VVKDLPGADLERLRGHLAQVRPGLVAGPLTGQLIPGGRSNLTYLVTDGHHEWVLRRPPLGHVLATAHDMAREHRVITALAGTAVPVPATVVLCPDPAVLGAPFYLMEKVEGTVYRSPADHDQPGAPPAAAPDDRPGSLPPPAERERLARAMVATLAALHRVDPAAVGLAGDPPPPFGRPDGFLARQVRRWGKQLAASRTRDLPGIEQLAERLAGSVPPSPAPAIVHGDYRLDNLLVRDGRIAAVLDWEMSTLGDPLTDLGLLLVYWDHIPTLDSPVGAGVGARHGFPAGATLVAWYAAGTGADVSGLGWYVAMGAFKLAVILEGIHCRYTRGLTVGEGFAQIGATVPPLVEIGLTALPPAPAR
jgi:aminoglycoside phosphotransferase (APT) family kinase protein